MNQWAITVGINQYHRFQPLSYAQRDAQALRTFLVDEAGFAVDRCLLLTDSSPTVFGKSTYPTLENLQSWIDTLGQRYLQRDDVLWFFFSGYGICHEGQDYVVPIDAQPDSIATTAIPLRSIYQRLRTIPTKTVLVLLDMNRSEGTLSNETLGVQTIELANQSGVPTVLSCQPGQFSREAAALGHGFFTAVLLEGLRSRDCETLESLDRYLNDRLPQLSEHYWRPIQQPLTISPPEKLHQLILLRGAAMSPLSPAYAAMRIPPRPDDTGYPRTAKDGIPSGELLRSGVSTTSNGNGGGRSIASDARLPESSAPTPASSTDSSTSWLYLPRSTADSSSPLHPNGNGHSSPPPNSNGHSTHRMTPQNGNHDPIQPPPPSVPNHPADEIPDALFWRPLLVWGGLAVALLLTGVLWRNWASITNGAQPLAQPPADTRSPSPSNPPAIAENTRRSAAAIDGKPQVPGQSSTPPAGVVAKPNSKTSEVTTKASNSTASSPKPASSARSGKSAVPRSQAARSPLTVARAKTRVKSDQASPYWFAIQEASKVSPSQPQYAQAQREIKTWSQDIANIAQRRASQKQFDRAILAAILIPQDQPVYGQRVKGAIPRWCSSLSAFPGKNPVQQQQAKNVCRRQPDR